MSQVIEFDGKHRYSQERYPNWKKETTKQKKDKKAYEFEFESKIEMNYSMITLMHRNGEFKLRMWKTGLKFL